MASEPDIRPRFRILGPVSLWSGGEVTRIAAAKPRSLLALLAIHANQMLSTDLLVDAIWNGRPPATARTALQGYVSALRRLLEPGRDRRSDATVLVTSGSGYELRVSPGELDRDVFERLMEEARAARGAGRTDASADLLDEALRLWHGPALADVAYEPWAAAEATRLDELKQACVEERIDIELARGRHRELVPELQALVADYPLRERLRGLLIVALYRSGRQVEALEVYRDARQTLVEELGLDPSPALRELEAGILRQDETLAVAAATRHDVPGLDRLPRPPSSLVGRQREAEAVEAMVRSHGIRIVTLTGPGGTGKTRLALAVATKVAPVFHDGVWWVSAEGVRDPKTVVPLIATTVGVEGDVREALSGRILVVVDNVEQVLEAGAELVRLVESTDGLTLLVTSRERLHVTGEHEYAVPPLETAEAVALFLERARAVANVRNDDSAVAEICRRVDCLPLGVELAAARVNVLEPRAILERLDSRLSLLTAGARDVPERQRTLRGAIEWSHDLLADQEALLFRRLAVFAGTFTLEAAEELCGATLDTLGSLVDKSLLRRSGERFEMLRTIHEYAGERLDASDEAQVLRRAHVDWCLALVRRIADDAGSATTPESLARLASERDNLRLALAQARATEAPGTALELAVELAEADFWRLPAPLREGRAELERALADAPAAPPELRARALYEAAALAVMQGDAPSVARLAEDLLALSRRNDDPLTAVRSLAMLASLAAERGDEATAVDLSEEAVSIATAAGDDRTLLNALNSRAVVDLTFGRYGSARASFDHCVRLARAVARRPHSLATATFNVALACLLDGDLPEAERALAESLRLSRELSDPDGIAYCFALEAALRGRRDEWSDAARLLAASRHLLEAMGTELESVERRVHDETLEAVRMRMGEPVVAAAWEDGRALAEAELGSGA